MIAVRSIDGRPLSPPSASPVNVGAVRRQPVPRRHLLRRQGTGAYQITTTYQTADDETCRSQKTLTDSDSDTNAISADSCFVTIPGSGDQSYYNYYNFTLSAARTGERERGQRRFHRHAQPAGCRRQSAGLRFRRRRLRRAVQHAIQPARATSRGQLPPAGSSATCPPAATTRSSTPSRPAIRNPVPAAALNFGDRLNRRPLRRQLPHQHGPLRPLHPHRALGRNRGSRDDSTSFNTILAIRDCQGQPDRAQRRSRWPERVAHHRRSSGRRLHGGRRRHVRRRAITSSPPSSRRTISRPALSRRPWI